jgi:hypothetical protein
VEPNPEDPVAVAQLHLPRLPPESHQLLPERHVLKGKIPPTLQRTHNAPHRDT